MIQLFLMNVIPLLLRPHGEKDIIRFEEKHYPETLEYDAPLVRNNGSHVNIICGHCILCYKNSSITCEVYLCIRINPRYSMTCWKALFFNTY